jgi:predicted Zn-dependent protease
MKGISRLFFSAVLLLPLLFSSCNKNDGFNIFSIDDDKKLGMQVHDQIASDPVTYPILDQTTYRDAYAYMYTMRDNILNSGQVYHKNDFQWNLYIIHDDHTLNAFCTPGGYIYVYTGLIKYLDNASSLAGVIGHEMGHADHRHSTKAMTEQYGISTLLDLVIGKKQNILTDVAVSLVSLKFSRENEKDADAQSVTYLCPTKYHADGAANFFNKIIASGSSNPPEFLSTHPNPDRRVENIEEKKAALSCGGGNISTAEDETDYAHFKSLLP